MKNFLTAVVLFFSSVALFAQTQALDPSFAQSGIIFEVDGNAQHIFPLLSNKIIVTGGYVKNGVGYSIVGYTAEGQPNVSFGVNGRVETISVGLFPYGRIKAFAEKKNIYIPGSNPDIGWEVVKYDTSGNKQLDFGGNGYIGGKGMQFLDAFTIDSQGRLIVGSTESTVYGQGTQLIRFLPNGNFDSSFGTNGYSLIVTENYGAGTIGLHLLSDGRILAGETGGGGAGTWMSVRFMPNGGPDTTYGDSGKVILPLPGYFMQGTVLQPDNKVLQWGDNDSLQVIRLKENGAFDSTFGTNGKARYQEAKMHTMLLMDDGRIVLGGDTEDSMFAIYRLMPNGGLDTSFGINGMVRIKLRPGGEHKMNDLAIQADGKLLAGGFTSNGLPYPGRTLYFTLARFMPNGRMEASSVQAVSKSAGILLYPNPAENTLLIQKTEAYASTVQLQIVDMTGRVVFASEYEGMGTQPVQIEVGKLAPGMYQVILQEAGGKTWHKPFVKQ